MIDCLFVLIITCEYDRTFNLKCYVGGLSDEFVLSKKASFIDTIRVTFSSNMASESQNLAWVVDQILGDLRKFKDKHSVLFII